MNSSKNKQEYTISLFKLMELKKDHMFASDYVLEGRDAFYFLKHIVLFFNRTVYGPKAPMLEALPTSFSPTLC